MVGTAFQTRFEATKVKYGSSLGRRSPFYLIVALTISVLMVAGLAYDVPRYVLHPTVQRPIPLLVFHSIVFIGWIIVYLVQNALVYFRKIGWHRNLGWIGVVLAVVMPPLGIVTAIAMRRFDLAAFHSTNVPRDLSFLAAPLSDILAFTPCAWLAIVLRKKPEYHRRLMLLSTTAIAEAGFSRLPIPGMETWFFAGNVMFYAAAVLHDRLTLGHVHKVYRLGVPLLILNEVTAMYLWLVHPAWWVATCRWLIA